MAGSRDIRRCGATSGWVLLVAVALVLGALWAPGRVAWGQEAAEAGAGQEGGAGEAAVLDASAAGTDGADTVSDIDVENKNTAATAVAHSGCVGPTDQVMPGAEESRTGSQDEATEPPEAAPEPSRGVSEKSGTQSASGADEVAGLEDGGEAPAAPAESGQAAAGDLEATDQDDMTVTSSKTAVGTEKTENSTRVVSNGGADDTSTVNAQVNTVTTASEEKPETPGASSGQVGQARAAESADASQAGGSTSLDQTVSTRAKASALRRAASTSTVTLSFDPTQGVGVTSAGTTYGTVTGQFKSGTDPSGPYPTTVKVTIPTTANVQDENGNGWTATGWTNELGGTSYKVAAGSKLSVADLLVALGLDSSTSSVTLYPVWAEPTITITYSVDKPTFGKVSKDKDVVGLISHATSSADGKVGCTATGLNGGVFFMWTVDGTKTAASYATNPNSATLVPQLAAIQTYLTTNGVSEFPFVALFNPASIMVVYDQGFDDDGSAVTDATVPASVSVTDTATQKGFLTSSGNRTASGYKFEGWYLDTSYATAASSLGSGDPTYDQMAAVQTPKDNTITLYAKWSVLAQDYTVEWWKYDYLGVKVGPAPIYSTTHSAQVSKQVNVTTDDTQLVGVPAANQALLVGYDYDASLSTLGPETLQEGVPVTFALAFRERTGYKVSYDLQNGVGGKLINGATIADKANQRWLATSIVPSTTASDAPTRVGYTFGGWYYVCGSTDATGTTTIPAYDYKTTVPTANVTYADLVANDPDIMEVRIYATWTEDEVTITYQANNPTFGRVSESSGAKAGQKLYAVTSTDDDVVASTATANKGYKFTGWKRVGTGGEEDVPAGFTSGEDGATIKPLKEAVSGTDIYRSATYIAQFEVDHTEEETTKHYTVYFNGNGPSSGVDQVRGQVNDGNSQAMTENVAAYLDANGFERAGFTFRCWNTVAEPTSANPGKEYGDGDLVSNLLGTDFEDGAKLEYLYAQWTELKAKITYSAGPGGQVSRHEEEVPDVTGTPLGCRATPDEGYRFVGWVLDGGTSGTGTSTASSTSGLRTLALSASDGTGAAASSNVIVDASSPTLQLSKGATGLWVAESYQAQFEPVTYTVAYKANGGTGTMSSDTFTYGVSKALSANGFTRDGYDFQGWNTSSDGLGTEVAETYAESKLSETDGDTVTLYAQWKQQAVDPGTDDPGTDEPTNPTDPDDPGDTPSTDDPTDTPTTPSTDKPTTDSPSTNTPSTSGNTSTETPGTTAATTTATTEVAKPAVSRSQGSAADPVAEATVASMPAAAAQSVATPVPQAKPALPKTGDATPPVALLLAAGLLLVCGAIAQQKGYSLLQRGPVRGSGAPPIAKGSTPFVALPGCQQTKALANPLSS